MSDGGATSFVQVGEDDMAAYADRRATEVDLSIDEPFKAGVLENLMALQGHARRMGAALQAVASVADDARETAAAPLR